MSKPKKRSKTPNRRIVAGAAFPATLQSANAMFTLSAARLYIVFRTRPNKATLAAALARYKLVLEDGGEGKNAPQVPVHVTRTPESFFVRNADSSPIPPATITALQADRAITMIAPVYARDGLPSPRSLQAALPHSVAVRFGTNIEPGSPKLVAALRELGLTLNEARSRPLHPFLLLEPTSVVTNPAHVAGPRLAQLFASLQPTIVYEWVSLVSTRAAVDPTDTLYKTIPAGDIENLGQQWDMKRVGARYAWGNNVGAGVNIYLVDEGIQQGHADFATALAAGRVSQRNTAGATDATTQPPNDDHGTAVAGVMFAGHNDGGTSTAGWASGANLISIRAGSGTTIPPVTNLTIQGAIAIAAGSGLPSVLTCRLDLTDPIWLDPGVQTALTNSANADVLIVVPSGNWTAGVQTIGYSTALPTPGALTPSLMVVGATDQGTAAPSSPAVSTADDIWKGTNGSGDPGSRHGPEVSVVAPGGSVKSPIQTLTIAGTGYTTGTGTSLAAAHVAGLAALVRSRQTTLTAPQVRRAIEHTAVKSWTGTTATQLTAPQSYVTSVTPGSATVLSPIGTVALWNEYMGCGRVDASAVLANDVQVDGADGGRADVYIRSYPADTGARNIPGGTDFWSSGDIIISTNAGLIATGAFTPGTGGDAQFQANVSTATNPMATTIPAPGGHNSVPVYVFVRVVNLGPAEARGLRVTAVICASATGFVYPNDWDHVTDTIHVTTLNDAPSSSYYPGPLPVNSVYIARLVIPANSDFTGFSGNHGCCAARVTAANDMFFANNLLSPGSGQMVQLNNIMQRNLTVV